MSVVEDRNGEITEIHSLLKQAHKDEFPWLKKDTSHPFLFQ